MPVAGGDGEVEQAAALDLLMLGAFLGSFSELLLPLIQRVPALYRQATCSWFSIFPLPRSSRERLSLTQPHGCSGGFSCPKRQGMPLEVFQGEGIISSSTLQQVLLDAVIWACFKKFPKGCATFQG